ncbi:MAG TPA: DUF3592 domain-containing protein [Gemmatimonadaceae bacterium]|jgi:hypothetical protein
MATNLRPSDLAFPFYVIGSGVVIIATFLPSTLRAHASLRWPRTVGRVRTSEDDVAVSLELAPGPEVEQLPHAEYDYSVGGKPYQGSTLGEPGPASMLRLIREEELRPGQSVMVSYDPRDHAISLLYPGASPFAYLTLGAGGAILIAGLVTLVRAILEAL